MREARERKMRQLSVVMMAQSVLSVSREVMGGDGSDDGRREGGRKGMTASAQ